MPDYSKGYVTFAEVLRLWPDAELLLALDEPCMDKEAVRTEIERRKRPCICTLFECRRDCPRHEGRP